VGEVPDGVPGGRARGDAERPADRADSLACLGADDLAGGGAGPGFQGVGDGLVAQGRGWVLAVLDVVVGADPDPGQGGRHVDDRDVVADLKGFL
jgi:hypothetical protein